MVSAVINTDFVNSTNLDTSLEKKFSRNIEKILSGHKYELYRGDSIQVYIREAADSLRIALLMRCTARELELGAEQFDIKLSIGLGTVKQPVKSLGTAKGEAFLVSGRAFDSYINQEKRFIIMSGKEPFDTGLEVMSAFIDYLFSTLTPKQARIVLELLEGRKQAEISKRLKKTQPTISKQANSAGWQAIQGLLTNFDKYIKLLS